MNTYDVADMHVTYYESVVIMIIINYYLKRRADLNLEVGFGVNGAIGTIVTKWDLILFG